jgi:iron complex outermembrane recepter protein
VCCRRHFKETGRERLYDRAEREGTLVSSRTTPLVAVGAVVLWATATASAQSPAAANVKNLSIPAESLANALNDLAQQSGLQVMFPSELVARLRSPEVKGSLTATEALQRLLTNTGLRFEFVNPHTITIVGPEPKPAPVSPDTSPGSPTKGEKPSDDKDSSKNQITSAPATAGDNAMPRRSLFARLLGLSAACGAALHGAGACAQDTSGGPAATDTTTLETVIVTARKRDESLATVPVAITVFTSQVLEAYNIQSFDDYATKTPNISFAYGGGPTGIADARTVAIRGITGQNLFGTAGATGFYIDDTPVPGSVDPRVLDIDNIEVLKGPQGTLFGESSLGGNVRLITKRPDLSANDIGYMVQAGATSGGGGADGGAGVIGNLVLSPDVLGVRVVLFGNHDAGYLTRTFPTDPASPGTSDPFLNVPRTSVGNQGAQTTYGGSISMLLKATESFEARARVMFQSTEDHGFPATFAPLPGFEPQYTLNRAFDVQPDARDNWTLPSLDLKYKGDGFSVVSSSSYFYRHTHDLEDSTYGTQQVLAGFYGVTTLPAQPFLWDGERYHNQLTEELRLSFDPIHNVSGTVGAFWSNTRSLFYIPPTYANGLVAATAGNTVIGPWPNDEIWTQNNPGTQKDTSLFGELYYKFLDKFTLTAGARKYWLKQTTDYTADGFMNGGQTPSSPQQNSESGVDPKVGLSYQATAATMVYASASKGFRAGGAQANFPACTLPGLPIGDIEHITSDTLWSYEVGTKIQVPQTGLLFSAAGFHINWDNLQQQVALPCGYYLQLNGGSATINGGEIELTGRVTPSFQLRFGVGYEKTDINNPGALSFAGVMPGARIQDTPAWTAALGGVYTQPLTSELDGFVAADYSYTGNSVSLLNGGSGLYGSRPPFSLVNLRFGVQHAKQEASLNIHNLTNAKPNLGDIGYLGYAQYDAAGTVIPQVATLQPFTVILQYKNNF